MTRRPPQRRWYALSLALALTALAAYVVAPPVRSGTGTSLLAGVAAALLLLFCGLLGARKRMLRLRVGSVAAWAAAHNALGILALALALIHSRAHGGGLLTSLLLATLTLVVLGGMLGVAIQFVIPRFMTGRFQRESSHTKFALLFVEQWGTLPRSRRQGRGTATPRRGCADRR